MDCCGKNNDKTYDLVIIGSGSAAFAGAINAAEKGFKIAMIERGTIGGSCVNVGCVPSKTLIRAAEAKHRAENFNFKGFSPNSVSVSFETVIKEKDELVDSLRRAKYMNVLDSYKEIDFFEGRASFISETMLQVKNKKIKGERFLIATGSSPWIPLVSGLNEVDYLTSTGALELKKLPSSMVVIGGRYIALELAQMFQRFGTNVTLLQRSNRIVPTEDADLTDELTNYLSSEGMTILTGVNLKQVSKNDHFRIEFEKAGKTEIIESEQLVVTTGRRANTGDLNLESIRIELNANGSIKTNEYCQTSQPHIYAAGDVIDTPAFVYTAAYEGNLAVENAINSNVRARDYSVVPSVVFTDPQVARVGLNELQAEKEGIEVDISKLSMDNLPRALAARDTRGFIKLIKLAGSEKLVGASILAPEGSELLMEIATAIKYDIPVSELASMFHPYLTLGEAVKLAAQTFNKDVKKLSCCAG